MDTRRNGIIHKDFEDLFPRDEPRKYDYRMILERVIEKQKKGLNTDVAVDTVIKELYPRNEKDTKKEFTRENYSRIKRYLYSDAKEYILAHKGNGLTEEQLLNAAKDDWETKYKDVLDAYNALEDWPKYDFVSIYTDAELQEARSKAGAVTNFLKQLARIVPDLSVLHGMVFTESFTSYYWMPYEFSGSIKRYGLKWFLNKYPDLCYAITAGEKPVFKIEDYDTRSIESTHNMLRKDVNTCKQIIIKFLSFYDAIKTMNFTRLLRAIETNTTQTKEPISKDWSAKKIGELRKFIKDFPPPSVGGYRRKQSGRKRSGKTSHKRSGKKSRKARKTRRN